MSGGKDYMGKRHHTKIERTAYHEAGHAVMSYLLGRRFRHVTIIPSKDAHGHIAHRPWLAQTYQDIETTRDRLGDHRIRMRLEREIIISLVGFIADEHFSGKRDYVGARGDSEMATHLAIRLCDSGPSAKAYLHWLVIRAREAITNELNWKGVEALAAALLQRKRIKGREAWFIIEEAIYGHKFAEAGRQLQMSANARKKDKAVE